MNPPLRHRLIHALLGALLPALWLCTPAQAALTSLNDEPLATQAGTSSAPPNLMFVIDDSGSMDWDYMPGPTETVTLSPLSDTTSYGYKASQCNGLAYDPSQTYAPPNKWDGSLYPAASYTAVWDDGFNPTSPGGLGGHGGIRGGSTASAVSTALTYSTGSKTLALNSGQNANLSTGSTIVVRDTNDISRWMLGTVTNVSGSSRCIGFYFFGACIGYMETNYTYTFTVSFYTGKDGASHSNWEVFAPNTTDLSSQTIKYYTYSGSQTKMGWTYVASGATQGNPDLTTTFARECMSHEGGLSGETGDSKFTAVTVSATGNSAAAIALRQNYANWYQYYRQRLLLMKTATGKAVANIPTTYRVGITKISHATDASLNTGYFLQVNPFTEDITATTQGQKYNFYAHLYGDNFYGTGGTPLRQSLAQIGKYYANKFTGETEPMTAACQRNYTVLTTDGYWNDSIAPTGLAKTGTGSTIGHTDGSPEVRPMLDTLSTASTLADVAEYFYVNDLRDATLWGNCPSGTDLCTNDTTATTDIGTVGRQNMITYTLGLGVGGTLNYVKNYDTLSTGDYAAIKAGTKNWPAPLLENATRVDDLWHAAVNGRGQYFSAQSATELATALESTVGKLVQTPGTGTAVASSAFQLNSTDTNYVYVGSYISGKWIGELQAFTIASDGTVATVSSWSAQGQLDDLANRDSRIAPASGVTSPQCGALYSNCADERVIYFMHPTTRALTAFTYPALSAANLDADGKFSANCGSTPKLSQCTGLSTEQKALVNTGKVFVNYLRGDATYEASNGNDPLFRLREAVLGDIANGTPAYAGKPPFLYSDTGYSDFVAAQASRTKVVYVAANDGMLHAFNALTGKELWAFVPNAVMPNLYKLADKQYSHQYSVDGSPVVADISVGGVWKTILVGGLNKGGKAYYALDVTDPSTPIPLWEYTHTNLGYTYGNPVITKNATGDWVVAFGSGYNNSGLGYLYLLDAYTGVAKTGSPIATTAGTAITPSGLAPLNAWVNSSKNNTALRLYGGDLLGNVWRFNIDTATVAPVANLTVSATTPQPITVRPELGEVSHNGTKYPVVLVGTGRYLHQTDVGNTALQSIYAIKDKLDATGWGDIRASGNLVSKSFTQSGSGSAQTRTATSSTKVDWLTKAGWVLDLRPTSTTLEGERVTVPMKIAYSTLVVAGNIPSAAASCRAAGGSAWLYYLTLADGYTSVAPMYQGSTMVSGNTIVYDSTGKAIVVTNTTDGKTVKQPNSPDSPTASTGGLRRVSWRELVN